MRIQPMNAAGGNPKCFIQYKAISVPVRPRPALQWTAIAPLLWFSHSYKKSSTISSVGGVPSKKYKSLTSIPLSINLFFSY